MILFSLLAIILQTAHADEVKSLSTRPGVTLSYALIKPANKPIATVILFTGGDGIVQVEKLGPKWGRKNFLVRNRQKFADQGFLVAVPDTPSDHLSGMGFFRTEQDHAIDISALIAALRKQSAVPVWVIGTSRGTVSATNSASRIKENGVDGMVLSSTVTSGHKETVYNTPLKDVRVPTLIVHHKLDACHVTPLRGAKDLVEKLSQSPKVEFLTFDGGETDGDACEGFAHHGFYKQDDEVVGAISKWIKERVAQK